MQNKHKDYGPIPGYHNHVPDSCNKEDAVRYLMYWNEQIILPFYKLSESYSDVDLEFYNCFSIADALRQELEDAEAEYRESKYNNQITEILAGKLASLEEYKLIVSKYYTYRSHLTDELAKLDRSALRIDQARTTNSKTPFITSISLFEWGMAIIDSLVSSKAQNQNNADSSDKAWLIKHPDDPEPEQDWYTPARHFARDLIRDDTTLLTKRNILADKVAQSLKNVGILKRGGKLPFNPATVKKAFANVNF